MFQSRAPKRSAAELNSFSAAAVPRHEGLLVSDVDALNDALEFLRQDDATSYIFKKTTEERLVCYSVHT